MYLGTYKIKNTKLTFYYKSILSLVVKLVYLSCISFCLDNNLANVLLRALKVIDKVGHSARGFLHLVRVILKHFFYCERSWMDFLLSIQI